MWEDFELDAEQIPAFKLAFHIAQIVFAFVLWCLEIAVFRADSAKIVGNNGWTFAVFFLTVPAWIYLIGAPRFPRTRKIANPTVMVLVDVIFTIIWLSAFATQAAYNSSGLCGDVCGISKAIVGMGVFVFLFFCGTTFLSIWTLKYYQWNNRLPGYDRGDRAAGSDSQNIDPDKAAFSLAPHDEEAYAPVNVHDADDDDRPAPYGGARSDYSSDPYGAPKSDYSDPYGSTVGVNKAANASTIGSSYQDNPFRRGEANANPFDDDTEYNSGRLSAMGMGGASTLGGSMNSRYQAPSVGTYDEEEDRTGPARFPQANYDHLHR
ncbi:hypothetical protein QBC41DRAFT_21460 [Cercophora samala]|uniref:MARVEL domain-containing protein n=1 Tax=Cercophora samala TaxID=330535 RepID=A0AA40D851_9PEZI|nr:hypothetical protein QBC41DRAFT_21460 [Cercophora samala]